MQLMVSTIVAEMAQVDPRAGQGHQGVMHFTENPELIRHPEELVLPGDDAFDGTKELPIGTCEPQYRVPEDDVETVVIDPSAKRPADSRAVDLRPPIATFKPLKEPMKNTQNVLNAKINRLAMKVVPVAAVMLLAQPAFAFGPVTLSVNGSTAASTVTAGSSVTLQETIPAPASAYHVSWYDNGGLLACSNFPAATVSCALSNIASGTHVFTSTVTYMKNAGLGPAVGGTTDVASNAVTVTASGANVAVLPKYQILNITYAPPGPNSSVSYQTAGTVATTITDTSSYINDTKKSVSLALSTSGKIFGFGASAGLTSTSSADTSQTSTGQNQITVSVSATTLGKTSGPALTPPGVTPAVTVNTTIDHDYDSVTLWLNPVALYFVGPNAGANTAVTMLGFATDDTDTNVVGMDTATVLMGYLNGHFPMPAGLAAQLGRSWANHGQTPPVDGVALTAADYAQILAADPYMNPAYVFNYANGYGGTSTSPDGRYTLVSTSGGNSSSFSYGDNITSTTLTFGYTNVSTVTNTTQNQQVIAFGLSLALGVSGADAAFTATLANTHTQTWTHSISTAVATTTAVTNALTLAPPCSQPGCYTSFPTIEVFQDNLYGTFMFFPTE
jgi:hypothetical protein